MAEGVLGLAAHVATSLHHAFVGAADGGVHAVRYDPHHGASLAPIGRFARLHGLASYAVRGVDHVFACDGDGEIAHLRLSEHAPGTWEHLGRIAGARHIAALPPVGHEHGVIIVADSEGTLRSVEVGVPFEPRERLRLEGAPAHLSVFRGGGAVHVLEASANGVLRAHVLDEHSRSRHGVECPGVLSLSGYWSPGDEAVHAVALLADHTLVDLGLGRTHARHTVLTDASAARVSAYWSPRDRRAHVVMATQVGDILDVAYRGEGAYQLRLLRRIGQLDAPLDVSPDLTNGTPQNRPSTAGLAVALAGDRNARYVVSLNAGVWRSSNDAPWTQLSTSPRYACCIASERDRSSHVAVGERNSDAVGAEESPIGVWESTNSGDVFAHVLDPRDLGCTSRAVPAVLFTKSGSLLVATERGVAVRPSGTTQFTIAADTANTGYITALSVGATQRLWARSTSTLFHSDDDGASWTSTTIPAVVDDFGIGFSARGDAYSLAAFGNGAVVVFQPQSNTPKALLQSTGNQNTLLYFDPTTHVWKTQVVTNTGNGTGLGGRRNIKSIVLDLRLPQAGGGFRMLSIESVYFISAQQVYAGDLNTAGQLNWTLFAAADWDNGGEPIHSDLWDVHAGGFFDAPMVTCDGGVYRQDLDHNTWVTWNQGLHTHHVHTLEVIGGDTLQRPQLAYTTSDNDQWVDNASLWAVPQAAWQGWTALGDSNWSKSDAAARDIALIVRHREAALMSSFGVQPPAGAGFSDRQGVSLDHYKLALDANNKPFTLPTSYDDGTGAFQVIQTLDDEVPAPLLDVVMLADLPFTKWDGKNNVPVDPTLPTGQPTPNGAAALLRNRRFGASPDVNVSKLGGDWTIEANDVPLGARRVWVSGGHDAPVYYLLVADKTAGQVIYRRATAQSAWVPLNNTASNLPHFSILTGGAFGPLFVNPYDSAHFYVLTSTGIKVSFDGGASFTDDAALTDLVTGGGVYPLVGKFDGGNGADVIMASRANGMAGVSSISFSRGSPHSVAAASPFTGVFYRSDVTSTQTLWLDQTFRLPQPLTPVSCVAVDSEAIYVATEGRGVLRLGLHDLGLSYEPPLFIPQTVPKGDPARDPGPAILSQLTAVLGALGLQRPRLAPTPVPNGTELESDVEIAGTRRRNEID